MDIEVPNQRVPVLEETDVLVCGAGCAGIAAAVSAARRDCRVALLERWPTVGGMATHALVNGWHRSDREKLVIHGLVEESAERAERHGWIRKDPRFPHAHETHWFEPEGMRIVWQRMLDEAGVRVLCYLAAGEPIVKDGRIRGVLVSTKRGLRAVLAKIVVDATGDGDVAAKAGVPFDLGRPGDDLVQGMTLMFRLHGIDPSAADKRRQTAQRTLDLMRGLRDSGQFPPFNEGNTQHYLSHADNRTLWNMLPEAGNPLDEEVLSRLTAEARERLVAYLTLWREHLPGYKHAAIDLTAFALGVRESRRIRGLKTLNKHMVLNAAKQPDAIGHGVWMIDIHDPEGTGYTTYTDRGKDNMLAPGASYHIPLGMCMNAAVPNLATVGRCASSTHEGHSSVRVQTHCMVMGQGAGTAAALALDGATDPADVDMNRLQATLRADGVYIEDVPNRAEPGGVKP